MELQKSRESEDAGIDKGKRTVSLYFVTSPPHWPSSCQERSWPVISPMGNSETKE